MNTASLSQVRPLVPVRLTVAHGLRGSAALRLEALHESQSGGRLFAVAALVSLYVLGVLAATVVLDGPDVGVVMMALSLHALYVAGRFTARTVG